MWPLRAGGRSPRKRSVDGEAGNPRCAGRTQRRARGDGVLYEPPHRSKDQGIVLRPGDSVEVRTPGGGGYGPASRRAPDRVARDVRRGYYTVEQARDRFLVCVSSETGEIDLTADGHVARQNWLSCTGASQFGESTTPKATTSGTNGVEVQPCSRDDAAMSSFEQIGQLHPLVATGILEYPIGRVTTP